VEEVSRGERKWCGDCGGKSGGGGGKERTSGHNKGRGAIRVMRVSDREGPLGVEAGMRAR